MIQRNRAAVERFIGAPPAAPPPCLCPPCCVRHGAAVHARALHGWVLHQAGQVTSPSSHPRPPPPPLAADEVSGRPGVFFVTMRQLLAWMADPVPLSQLTPEVSGRCSGLG